MSQNIHNDHSSQTWIVGKDPCSNSLAVLPEDVVVTDGEWIQFLLTANTIGQIRKNARAVSEAKQWYEDLYSEEGNFSIADVENVYGKNPPPFDDLAADIPFNLVRWFGDDSWYLRIPEARVRTGKLAPREIVELFGQPDTQVGLDYVNATWFQLEDRMSIVSAMERLGYAVRNDDDALQNYYYFGYSG